MFELNKDSKIRALGESVLDSMHVEFVKDLIREHGSEKQIENLNKIELD